MLTLKLPGKEGSLSYAIPLHLLGPQLEIVASPAASATGLDAVGAGFKSLLIPKDAYRVVRSTLHTFPDPVRDLLGPLSGHLVLISEAGRLDFFSLESRKVTKTITATANARYFAGAQALFEYDATTRTLTRISVPAGQRERAITMPGNLQLHGLGVGTAPDSPLTLVLEQIQKRETERFGDLTLTLTLSNRDAVILDSHTLSAAGWAQPKAIQVGTTPSSNSGYDTSNFLPRIVTLPASHDGQFVTLSNLFFALGHGSSYTVRFPENVSGLYDGKGEPSGSISGTTVSNSMGMASIGRMSDNYNQKIHPCFVTPCGRYRLIAFSGDNDNHIEVRTVAHDRLLFHIGRLALNRREFSETTDKIPWRLVPLGDDGPLAVLAGGGKALEIIDCDIPRVAQAVNPSEFHVTSQCPPCVLSGTTLEYQIQVNNPAVVATYSLREPIPGASLTPEGLLRYTGPPVTSTTRVTLTTEIKSKDGNTVLHEFPIFVLPAPSRVPLPTGRPSSV